MYQYRIEVDGTAHLHRDYPGEVWARAAEAAEERGLVATLHRRLVTDLGILDYFDGQLPEGWLQLGGKIATAWEVFAQVDGGKA
jgi:hypothetical protein